MPGTKNYRDIPIMRDGTFHRSVADNAVVFPLGRDLEIGFLAVSPVPTTNRVQLDDSGEETDLSGVQIQNALSEVARVRMAPESALALAVQIVAQAISSGSIDFADFEQNFKSFEENKLSDAGEVFK